MASEKRTTTIELTSDDDRVLGIVKHAIGTESTIAAIRYALRETAEGLTLDAARLAQARATAQKMTPLDDFMKEFRE